MNRNLISYQQGSIGKGEDMFDYTYYDTQTIAATTTSFRMFQTPVGQGGKTLDKTNLKAAGTLPQGEQLIVGKIKAMYYANAIANDATFQNILDMFFNTTVEIIVQNKDVGIFTLAEIFGISLLTVQLPTVAGNNVNVPEPRFHGIFPLNTPIMLAALNSFELRVTHQTAAAATLNGHGLRIGLNGVLKRLS